MRKPGQLKPKPTGGNRWVPQRPTRRIPWVAGALCALALFAGCNNITNRNPAPSADPLLVGPAAPAPASAPSSPGATVGAPIATANPPPATAPAPVAPLPPPPASADTPSTASLAIGGASRTPAGSPLAQPIAPPSPQSWQGSAEGAVLNAPQPLYQPVARRDPSMARTVAPVSAGRVMTYEQAQALLAARGVKWQRLETWGDAGNWKFSCSIPNRQNAFISRTYEAQAPSYLAAVQAVLAQIESESK